MKIKSIIFKGLLIIIVVLIGFYMSILIVSAEEIKNFEIEIVPHYYNQGFKLITYSEDIEYDGIALEIWGGNRLLDSRIVDIKIFEITPEIFNKSLTQKIGSLRINQTKILFETEIIELKDINDSRFFMSVLGINENDGGLYYGEVEHLVLNIGNKTIEKNVSSSIGDLIWEGESEKGLWIAGIIIIIIIGIIWKYELLSNVGNSMDSYRRKEKYGRMK